MDDIETSQEAETSRTGKLRQTAVCSHLAKSYLSYPRTLKSTRFTLLFPTQSVNSLNHPSRNQIIVICANHTQGQKKLREKVSFWHISIKLINILLRSSPKTFPKLAGFQPLKTKDPAVHSLSLRSPPMPFPSPSFSSTCEHLLPSKRPHKTCNQGNTGQKARPWLTP